MSHGHPDPLTADYANKATLYPQAIPAVPGPDSAAALELLPVLEPRPGQQPLDDLELGALWWRLMDARTQFRDEANQLSQCPLEVRDSLYGPGILELTIGAYHEVNDLLEGETPDSAEVATLVLGGRRPGLYVNGNKV